MIIIYNINTKKIKAKIYEKGYTIKEVAKKLNIHEQTLSNYINGKNLENINKFLELLNFLELEIKDIKK